MKRAVGYARFSSDEQDRNSIEMQKAAINEYAGKNGCVIADIYVDEARTGRDDDRENFQRMLSDFRTGRLKAETVLVYKMSRLFRDSTLWGIYEHLLAKYGVNIVSVTEPLPENSAMANFQKSVIRAFDQLTSDTIGMLSRDGTIQVVKAGYWSGGKAPIGYKNARIKNREGHTRKGEPVIRGTLVPDERLAPVVRRAFEIAEETGKGGHLILRQLESEFSGPILGPYGGRINGSTVNAILQNPIYKGEFIYNNFGYRKIVDDLSAAGRKVKQRRYRKPRKDWIVVRNEAWRLVSDERWEAVQKIREKNKRSTFGGHGNGKAAYALTGLVACGACGGRCGGKWQRSKIKISERSVYYYYRCRNAMNGSTVCSNKAKFMGKKLEAAVLDRLLTQVLDEHFIEELAAQIIEQQKREAGSDAERPALEARLKELADEQRRLVELAGKVGRDLDAVAERLKDIEKERGGIVQRLEQASSLQSQLTLAELCPRIRRRLQKARDLFKTDLDLDDLRILLGRWVDQIRLDADGKAWVRWKRSAVTELLDLPPMSDCAVSGTRYLATGHWLEAWHPLDVAPMPSRVRRRVSRPAATRSGFIGFSGFSGFSACPESEDASGKPAQELSSVQGFSGFAA